MSAEQEPTSRPDISAVTYEADPDSWAEMIAYAEKIIDKFGTEREQNGVRDADWSIDLHEQNCVLLVEPRPDGSKLFWLKIDAQNPQNEESRKASYLGFFNDKLRVSHMSGPAFIHCEGMDINDMTELLEMEVKSYLLTHPGLSDDK